MMKSLTPKDTVATLKNSARCLSVVVEGLTRSYLGYIKSAGVCVGDSLAVSKTSRCGEKESGHTGDESWSVRDGPNRCAVRKNSRRS